ncbi:hypothetical protein BTURTLESOX_131 [bacterium endosymbiont of Bathymodiolus sp. 5 South]|nr:hypothetical protein BTURTLESOX_131 [bacterium endosymbiont of Bathymodiolus sp. 5 South]
MIAGGLASKAGGGSFEDGAIAAEMVFLYNSFGFKVDKNRAGGNGHTTLYLQDKKGNWYAYDQGAIGNHSPIKLLANMGVGARVSLRRISSPSKDAVMYNTTVSDDKLIYRSAIESQKSHNSGKILYRLFSNNCTDAAVDVINNSGVGINIPNSAFTVKPNSWFEQFWR